MTDVLFYALPAVALVASVFFFRHTRERVRERFRKVANRVNGRVARAPWFLYPRLVVPMEGADVQLSGIHGSKNRSTCTFAWVGCREYPELTFDVRRTSGRVGMLERIGWEQAATGDRDFDGSFWISTKDADAANAFLDSELRRALLAFDERLLVRLRLGSTTAFRDGRQVFGEEEPRLDVSIRELPAEVDDIERLVDVAALAHTRLLPNEARASA